MTTELLKRCYNGDSSPRSKRSVEKKEEPVPSPSISGLQRTPKAEHPSRKRTVSQSSTSLSSGTGSGKEGSHSTKGNSTSKHRKGEDKGRGARDGKVNACNLIAAICCGLNPCTPTRLNLNNKMLERRWSRTLLLYGSIYWIVRPNVHSTQNVSLDILNPSPTPFLNFNPSLQTPGRLPFFLKLYSISLAVSAGEILKGQR